MGIRTFTFNGESSDTYGVLITQNESYNAPARAGEMVSIPGRNGAYWHDLGRFENIEVTYKCAIGEGTKADFVDAMSDIRAWLCSPIGYCRLEDDYNPNEYRMAVYKSGLETSEPFVTGAEFEITFDCKPQRFLKSGETATAVASGGTVTNPTLFDSKPQLQVWGYGDIGINGETIAVHNLMIGNILLANAVNGATQITLDMTSMNSGDSFTVSGANIDIFYSGKQGRVQSVTVTATTNCTTAKYRIPTNNIGRTVYVPDITFANGTASSQTSTCSVAVLVLLGGNLTTTNTTWTIVTAYDGANKVTFTVTTSTTVANVTFHRSGHFPDIFGDSTKSALGNPMYIDLDIGECYNTDSGSPVSVNNAVSMPAELPVLPSGATTITYDNTVTQFKIVPRWWQV